MTAITSVLRVIAPLLVYFTIMFAAVLFTCKKAKMSYGRTTAQAFTGASNNFEVRTRQSTPPRRLVTAGSRYSLDLPQLAIAVAIAAYGPNSPQALAATVGPLVECVLTGSLATEVDADRLSPFRVPVLLGLAYLLNWYRKRENWDIGGEEGSVDMKEIA